MQKQHLNNYRLIVVAIFTMGCIALALIALKQLNSRCQEDVMFERSLDSNFISLKWVKSKVYLPKDERSIYLISKNAEEFFVYGARDKCSISNLKLKSMISGEVLQENVHGKFSEINFVGSDSVKIYLGFEDSGKVVSDKISGAGGVFAYDISLNQVIWSRRIPGAGGVRFSAVAKDLVVIDGGGASREYYIMDVKSGEIVDSLAKEVGNRNSSYAYLYSYIDQDPNREIDFWQKRFRNIYQPPVLIDDLIVFRTNLGTTIGTVKVVDFHSGDLVWSSEEEVISNVSIVDGFVHYVTESAVLVVANLKTGETMHTTQVSGGNTQLSSDYGFYLTANNNNQVLVYFGDSRQIFAIEYILP